MKRALVFAVLAAAVFARGAEAHFGTAKLGYRSTITAVKPHMPGLKFKVLMLGRRRSPDFDPTLR